MSLQFAILGILNVMPMTGYDLKRAAFDRTVQHFWPADQSQIYRTLARMAEQGLVTMRVEPQPDRPDRKVYAITDEGRAALDDWLTAPQPPPTIRDPFLVQLFFGMEMSNEALLALVEQQLGAHRERLHAYRQIPIPPTAELPDDRWLALQHLTLDLGLALEQTYEVWLQKCQDVIAALPQPDEGEDFRTRFGDQRPSLTDNP